MHKLNINFQRPGPALATWWYWKEKWEAAVNVWNQWILKRESKPGPKQSLFLHNLLVAAVFPRCCLLFVRGKPRAWPGLAVASVTREAAQPWINPSAVLPSLHEGKKALNWKKQNKLLQHNSDIILIWFFLCQSTSKTISFSLLFLRWKRVDDWHLLLCYTLSHLLFKVTSLHICLFSVANLLSIASSDATLLAFLQTKASAALDLSAVAVRFFRIS